MLGARTHVPNPDCIVALANEKVASFAIPGRYAVGKYRNPRSDRRSDSRLVARRRRRRRWWFREKIEIGAIIRSTILRHYSMGAFAECFVRGL